MIATVIRRFTGFLLASASFTACSQDSLPSKRAAGAQSTTAPKIDDSAAGSIDLGGAAYSATNLAAVGAVSGTIRLADGASSGSSGADSASTDSVSTDSSSTDSTTEVATDCGTKPAPAPTRKTFANTIVWVANVKAGKALALERRADLASEKCLIDPRVQAVTVGTTMNIINDDKVLHRLVFTKLGRRDTLTVTPFFNTGQVVASERLAKTTGIVEVRCAQHPWTRGYIAVFDHPYFAVTANDGSFTIDSLPPGNYTMMVWREGAAKPIEQRIQVAQGGTARVDLK